MYFFHAVVFWAITVGLSHFSGIFVSFGCESCSYMERLRAVFNARCLRDNICWFCRGVLLFGSFCKHVTLWSWSKLQNCAAEAGRETGLLAISLLVNHNLHALERSLWLVVIMCSIYGALKLCNLQYKRYFTSSTVVSVDRDYRGWTGSLPAVTLCYHDHLDSFKANEYIQDQWNISIIDEDYFYFMEFLYAVINSSASNYADLARFAEDERFDDVDLYDLVRSIDRPFDQVFSSFDTNFEVQVTPVMTERGSCYVINSPIADVLNGSDVKFVDLKPPLTCQYGKQQCYIKMDLYEGTGTIDVHSPYEVSSTDASVIALHKSYEIVASYKVLETVASRNLRDLSVQQRKCVFHDEETSSLKVYSKTLCLARCRAIMALEMCNCVPFFYPFVDGPSCNPAGFECLLDFKWPVWALHICKCPSTCTEIEYTIQTVKKSSWGMKSNEEGMKTDVATSSFRWDLIPPKVRMRRDVVYSFEDLLVSFGGALALFLGVSLVSVTQLAYVFLWNLLCNLYEIIIFQLAFWRTQFKRLKVQLRNKEVRVAPIAKRHASPKWKRKSLAAVHRKMSNDYSNEIGVEDKGSDVDQTMAQPEFEYVN